MLSLAPYTIQQCNYKQVKAWEESMNVLRRMSPAMLGLSLCINKRNHPQVSRISVLSLPRVYVVSVDLKRTGLCWKIFKRSSVSSMITSPTLLREPGIHRRLQRSISLFYLSFAIPCFLLLERVWSACKALLASPQYLCGLCENIK
jgi:hypothetical protein